MRAVEPAVAELTHRVDDRQQGLALRRQLVLDARRRLGVAAALDDSFALELAQPLGERARADPRARVLELREPARPFREVVDEERRPLGADDRGRRCNATGRGCVDGIHGPGHRAHCRNGIGHASIFGIVNRAIVPNPPGAGLQAWATPRSQATERKMKASSIVKPCSSTSSFAASSETSCAAPSYVSWVAWGSHASASSVTGQVA